MIAEHVYSSRFGTFIVNSERERDEVRLLDILYLLILNTNKWMGKAVTLYITIIVFDLPRYKDHTLVCFFVVLALCNASFRGELWKSSATDYNEDALVSG